MGYSINKKAEFEWMYPGVITVNEQLECLVHIQNNTSNGAFTGPALKSHYEYGEIWIMMY